MTNPYGCPERIYRLIVLANRLTTPPMLRAIAILGPSRVNWMGGHTPNGGSVNWTLWALDGARAAKHDLLQAADLTEDGLPIPRRKAAS